MVHRLSCGMWDLPRPGFESVSPALAGRFLTTAPPGEPLFFKFKYQFGHIFIAHIKNLMQLGEKILVIAIMDNYIIKLKREKYSFSSQGIKNKFN